MSWRPSPRAAHLGLHGEDAARRHGETQGAGQGDRRGRQGDGRHRRHRRQCRHHRAGQAGRSRGRSLGPRCSTSTCAPTGCWPRRRTRISAQSKGAIVMLSSMSGVMPQLPTGAYSPAKAALIMLTEMMAMEWAPDGIRANAVCPGFVHTSMTEAIYSQPKLAKARAGDRAARPDRQAGRHRRRHRLPAGPRRRATSPASRWWSMAGSRAPSSTMRRAWPRRRNQRKKSEG